MSGLAVDGFDIAAGHDEVTGEKVQRTPDANALPVRLDRAGGFVPGYRLASERSCT